MKTHNNQRRSPSPVLLLTLAALSALVIALCVVRGVKAQGPPVSAQVAHGWIISAATVALLRRSGASDRLIANVFDNPDTYVVVRPQIQNTLPHATPTQTFTSYEDIQRAFANSAIAPSTKAILYDDERWQFTPIAEQKDPIGYAAKVADLVHRHGLRLVATPATNLGGVINPGASDRYANFLSLDIIAGIAKVADVVEVQAQGAQGTPRYASFVQAAGAQALAANPAVKFYAGMSTNPTGRLVSALDLSNDYAATRRCVAGYWLNVPGRSPYCPTCGTPHPEVALALLRTLVH